jgi:DNA-binding transcriptional LysR family regulator
MNRVECGTLAAGELVARTQSAVSVQIKRLEETPGKTVFERTSRSLALTPAGETLLGYARRILELNDESVRRIAEPPVTGSIRLGITEYFVPSELSQILSRFTAAYPDVHLEVRMGLSRELREALSGGSLDAAIVRLKPRERANALWSEPQVWAVREGSEPERGGIVPLALLPEPRVLRAHALESMKRLKRRYKIAFTGSSMASVQAAVSAGLGVSILPRSSLLPGMQVLNRGRTPIPGGWTWACSARRRRATPLWTPCSGSFSKRSKLLRRPRRDPADASGSSPTDVVRSGRRSRPAAKKRLG